MQSGTEICETGKCGVGSWDVGNSFPAAAKKQNKKAREVARLFHVLKIIFADRFCLEMLDLTANSHAGVAFWCHWNMESL